MVEVHIQEILVRSGVGFLGLATVRNQKTRLGVSPSFDLAQNRHSISCVATQYSFQ